MIYAEYVEFDQPSGERVRRLEVSGHAGYAPAGQDIVCAGASVLVETLVYALAGSEEAESCAYSEPTGPRVSVKLTGAVHPEDLAALEFTKSGLALLAERYPSNVRFEDKSKDGQEKMVDLQLFAEGGGDGGATAGGEGGTAEAPAAPELPKLRPAEERLARRSGVLKRTAQGAEGDREQHQTAQGKADAGKQATESAEKQEGEDPADQKSDGKGEGKEAEKAAPSPEEHRRAFGELMKGEYAEEFAEAMQRAAEAASRQMMENPAMKGLLGALAEAYGTDAGDLNALTEAVKNGRVKDEAYYEQVAMERGISVKTAKEMDKLESQNRKLTAAQQLAQQQQQAAQRQAEMEAIHAKWDWEAEGLRQQYPGFDLHETLNNPEVSDLMRRGVSLSNAYRAIYFDRLMADATAQTAKQTEQGVLARVQQRNARPGENGTRPGGAVQTKLDINSMTRKEREALERRVLRGEKITFT